MIAVKGPVGFKHQKGQGSIGCADGKGEDTVEQIEHRKIVLPSKVIKNVEKATKKSSNTGNDIFEEEPGKQDRKSGTYVAGDGLITYGVRGSLVVVVRASVITALELRTFVLRITLLGSIGILREILLGSIGIL